MKTFTTVLLCVVVVSVHAQFNASLDFSLASYKMKDLKDLQESELQGIKYFYPSLPIREVKNFPVWITPQLTASYTFAEKYSLGVFGAYYTTGGRISYEDFSGKIREDKIVEGYFAGVYQHYRIYSAGKRWQLNASLRTGLVFGTFTMDHTFILYESELNYESSEKYKSKQIGAEPAFQLNYFFTESISARFNAGYHFHLYSEKMKSEYDFPGNFFGSRELSWEGMRIGFGCGIKL